jgi:outer membrane protein OmpA-like peptidoglycan-associated protein
LQKSEKAQLIALAKQCQSQILLTGHTCNSGVDWSNQILGLARANSIKQLLIKNGIPSHRIITRSEGMLKPAVPNDTKSGQALNRRTEVACIGSV